MLKSGSTATKGIKQLRDLGISPKPLSLFLDRWMTKYRRHGRFTDPRSAA